MNRQDYEDCAAAVEQHMNDVGLTYLSEYGLLRYCEWRPPWVAPIRRRKVRKGSITIGERLGV